MSVNCLRIGAEAEYVVPEPIYEVQGREARPVASLYGKLGET